MNPLRSALHLALPALLLGLLLACPADAGEDAPRVAVLPAGEDIGLNSDLEAGSDGTPEGWRLGSPPAGLTAQWGAHGIEGSRGFCFAGTKVPEDGRAHASASQVVPGPPANASIEITVWFRLTEFDGKVLVWARCDGADGVERREGAYDNSERHGYVLEGSTIWSPVTIRLKTSKATKQIAWGILVRGTGEVCADEARVRVVAGEKANEPDAKPAGTGPGLYRAEGRYRVLGNKRAKKLRVFVPVPILWRDQIPLDFRVWSEPEGHVESVRLIRREHGYHVADVRLTGLGKGDVRIAWDGHVLVLPHVPTPLPKGVALPLEDVPDDVAPWLAATWCCDAKSEAIREVAKEIREVGETADVIVPATLKRMQTIFRSAEGRVDTLTADEALTKRGSCTSCANLGAALLRAHGIPARVIAGYPLWSGPLQTHYVVEYWLPEGGWRLMESTRCLDDRPGYEQIEVAMVLPEDEVEERAGRRKGAAGGVPYLSLTEYPDADTKQASDAWLSGATEKRGCDHQAVRVAVFEASDAAWRAAAKKLALRWQQLTNAAVERRRAVSELARPDALPEDAATLDALLRTLTAD